MALEWQAGRCSAPRHGSGTGDEEPEELPGDLAAVSVADPEAEHRRMGTDVEEGEGLAEDVGAPEVVALTEPVTVGAGLLPLSQIRRKPGLAGNGTISLEPILAPGRLLVQSPDGALAVAASDGTAEFAQRSSFRQVAGLADPRGVSFAALGMAGEYIRHSSGNARVGPVRSAGEPASATFVVG